MARARMRFIVTPWFTYAFATVSESRSPTFFCSALATAESSSFFTIRAAWSGVNVKMLRASPTRLPRIRSMTCLALRGVIRICLTVAVASMCSSSLCTLPGSLLGRASLFRGLGSAMGLEGPGGGEFAKLVADHVFRYIHGNEFFPVMDSQGMPDKLGNDR